MEEKGFIYTNFQYSPKGRVFWFQQKSNIPYE